MKRARVPRTKPPNELPLDDGVRQGPELWREFDGVAFCHWDRWLLRLSLEEPEGLRSTAAEFKRRGRGVGGDRAVAEAMAAQVADLEARLASTGQTPTTLLDEAERESKWLRDKAFRRVWHGRSLHLTAAMERTPRKLLEARANEGHWGAFPVSPAPYYARLRRIYVDCYYDYRGVELLVFSLELESKRLYDRATGGDERLVIGRAMLRASIEAMEHCDDSGELGDHFRDQERVYLECLTSYLGRPGLLRDLLELAVWEDYGLFHHIETYLARLPEDAADLAMRELARIMAELRVSELGYQLRKARHLRQAVLRAESLSTVADE